MSSPISRLAARIERRKTEQFLVDTIFPNGALHIISGPSGVGKTTWFMQQLHAWQAAQPVLGFASHPCDWVYVTLDRSLQETDRTLRRIGLGDWDIPCWPMTDVIPRESNGKLLKEPSYTYILDKFPKAKLICVEGLQGFMPNCGRGQSQNKAELIWAMRLQDEVLNRGITMIATTHSPKSSDYANDREKMLGSQALIGAASSILHFDVPPDSSGKARAMSGMGQTNDRLVTVMGRDFPNIYCNYMRNDFGGFELSSMSQGGTSSGTSAPSVTTEIFETHSDIIMKLDSWFNSLDGFTELGKKDFVERGRLVGLSDTSVADWVKSRTESGMMLKEGGRYRKSLHMRVQ